MGYRVTDERTPPEYLEYVVDRARKGYKGETSKAHARRLREGWYSQYAPEDRVGIDIGCSDDPINQTFRRWDLIFGDGDATDLDGVPADSFYTVYASHVLEHLKLPNKALRRWYEVLKPGGHLIVCVPHRDLYEGRSFTPSQWNDDHKYFWLPDVEEPPCTKSLKREIMAAIPAANIVSFRVLDEGHDPSLLPNCHPIGEYSIEAIIQKPRIPLD
jgi:SAM-dependent methyltransferase